MTKTKIQSEPKQNDLINKDRKCGHELFGLKLTTTIEKYHVTTIAILKTKYHANYFSWHRQKTILLQKYRAH